MRIGPNLALLPVIACNTGLAQPQDLAESARYANCNPERRASSAVHRSGTVVDILDPSRPCLHVAADSRLAADQPAEAAEPAYDPGGAPAEDPDGESEMIRLPGAERNAGGGPSAMSGRPGVGDEPSVPGRSEQPGVPDQPPAAEDPGGGGFSF